MSHSPVVIEAAGLGKCYRIRRRSEEAGSFRELMSSPWKYLRAASVETEDFWALRDVGFQVSMGERVGIVGKNGAGKSTLLKVLSRIVEPTAGHVRIAGRVASLLEVGTGFHPELSGRENVYLNGSILGMRAEEVRRKFDQIVDFAGVARFLDTPVKRYSSGMYVRLAFAVAAHLDPDILIVDEVLAVGDIQFQKKCLGRMNELSQDGRTVLFVTHNMDAMQALCDRALVLEKGSIVFSGSADSARRYYLEQAAAADYSLENHSGRGGSGGALIESVRVSDGAVVYAQGRLQITVQARLDDIYWQCREIDVALGIDTVDGQRLFTTLSSWGGLLLSIENGRIAVSCDMDALPLIPGRYLLSASLIFRGDTLDSVSHCAVFDVHPNPGAVHVERLPSWGALDVPCVFRNLKG